MKLRVANVEKCTCPYCHALIYLNHNERRTYHKAPVCQQWLDFCANSRGKWEGECTVIEVDAIKRKPS